MKINLMKISPFWSYLDFFTIKRLAIIFTISLFIFELMAIIAPTIWGKYVHRPFTVSHTTCREECHYQGDKVHWITNERGARGELYNGQHVQIAVFGSSTSSNSLITQQLTWPEQIKYNLKSLIHIDNFAKDGAGNKEIEAILTDLIKKGREYDAILIMDHYGHEERAASDEIAFSDWGKVSSDWQVKSLHLLAKHAMDVFRDAAEKIDYTFSPLKTYFRSPSLVDNSTEFKHPRELDVNNRALRKDGRVKLIDLPDKPLKKNTIHFIQNRVKTLNNLALELSTNVYFLIQPVAYDENELPGVSDRWYSLYPISKDKPHYKSNKTVAAGIRNVQEVVCNTADNIGAKVINLDEYLRYQLNEFDNLFLDKWHLAPIGNEKVGSMIAKRLIEDGVIEQ